jgi:hypothetical protein
MASPQLSIAYRAGMADRRQNHRFPLRADVRYRLLHSKSRNVQGAGRTLNMSSRGVFFTVESELPHGRMVALTVNWPARLGGVCPLQLVAIGRMVRCDGARAAVHIEKYEFRTRASDGFAGDAAG